MPDLDGDLARFQLPSGEERIAYVAYPDVKQDYAVVHLPCEHSRRYTAPTRRHFERRIEPRLMPWTPTRHEKALLSFAIDGSYDDLARTMGFESPISLILHRIEAAKCREGVA